MKKYHPSSVAKTRVGPAVRFFKKADSKAPHKHLNEELKDVLKKATAIFYVQPTNPAAQQARSGGKGGEEATEAHGVTKKKPDVCISYAHADLEEIAKPLYKALTAADVNLWMDSDIALGDDWTHAIEDAMNSCKCLLVILTPESAGSPEVATEVAIVQGKKGRIVPVLYKKCTIPSRLKLLHHVDFTTHSGLLLGAFSRLLGALKFCRNT